MQLRFVTSIGWGKFALPLVAALLLFGEQLSHVGAAVDFSNPLIADAWFDTLDQDHNEQLSKQEYREGLSKLQLYLQQPSNVTASAAGSLGFGGGNFLDTLFSGWSTPLLAAPENENGGNGAGGFYKAFTSSLAMIIATEIGDKTFFIAAVLSMKHDRWAVFGGAILALVVMTVLSTALGMILPSIIPRRYTHILGGILFLFFGYKLLHDGYGMEVGKSSDELEEVEEELLMQSNKKRTDRDEEEAAKSNPSSFPVTSLPTKWYEVGLQAFTLTFLAEWGDRSQIATIALAAAKSPIGVTIGGCIGHALCTGLAVIGGRMLAARISERAVSLAGGVIFLLFGIHSVFFET